MGKRMEVRGRSRWGACLLAAALPSLGLACRREDPEIKALTEKAAHTDEASRELRQAWSEQLKRLARAGVMDPPQGDQLMLLTEDQRRALETRIRLEKDSSRRAILREALEKDGEIRSLQARLAEVRAGLPQPDVVQRNDSHYGLALHFLKRRGVPEGEARALLSRVTISERIAPGFEVYHFYLHGTYGTWVAQGTAPFSPQDLARQDLDRMGPAPGRGPELRQRLQKELDLLEGQKRGIEREMLAIQEERRSLLEGRAQLQTDHERQLERLNSLNYLVGTRQELEREGIIEIPLFDKDRSGPNWRDEVFTRSLDLRTERTLLIQAKELGLPRITRVLVVPGSYLEDEHYRLSISPDRQSATVELLAPLRFRNDKVVFAVQ
ncbi:MAG TPA: hypothetical protein VJ570_06330 [Holophagaceae bacterium]|nr:hypothetical protein [Holophagaceae bacterium]